MIAGDAKAGLTQAIFDAVARDGFEPYQREWNYYPVRWREPFLGRRRKIGWDMYSLLGVAKGDFEGTQQAQDAELRVLRRARRHDLHAG